MITMRNRIRMLREEAKLNQSEVANALNMSRSSLSNYENGMTPPTDTCISLANYYGVSLDFLLGLTNERKPAGGRLADAFAELSGLAGSNAPTASDVLALLETAADYYRHNVPCGDIPLQALRGFLSGLQSALVAAGKGDAPALLDASNAAVIAALDINKMTPLLYQAIDK